MSERSAVEALFVPDGDAIFVPTVGAIGPWNPEMLHGAALAALFAGRLTSDDRTLGRLTVELLAPVPFAPLHLELSGSEGGRRAQRRHAALTANGRRVASATAVTVLRTEFDVPSEALDHHNPFADIEPPDLSTARPALAEAIGWENFHSTAVATKHVRVADDPTNSHQFVALTVPVVAGTEILGVEVATAAADFASEAMHRRLPFTEWSFMSCDLTLHLVRPPSGRWIGMNSGVIVQPMGTAIASTQLFDACGRVGQSASTLVVEARQPRTA